MEIALITLGVIIVWFIGAALTKRLDLYCMDRYPIYTTLQICFGWPFIIIAFILFIIIYGIYKVVIWLWNFISGDKK